MTRVTFPLSCISLNYTAKTGSRDESAPIVSKPNRFCIASAQGTVTYFSSCVYLSIMFFLGFFFHSPHPPPTHPLLQCSPPSQSSPFSGGQVVYGSAPSGISYLKIVKPRSPCCCFTTCTFPVTPSFPVLATTIPFFF